MLLARHNSVPKVLYHGAYFPHRGLDEIIDATRFIENAQIVFRGMGAYEVKLRERAHEKGVADKVAFVPPVPMTELVETASSCDIGLNPFVNVCKNTEFALPNKFFEYMMAGLAVMSSDLIEMRQLTQSLDVGRVFPQLTPRAMADTLNELLSNRDAIARYRQNSYFAARERYNWGNSGKPAFWRISIASRPAGRNDGPGSRFHDQLRRARGAAIFPKRRVLGDRAELSTRGVARSVGRLAGGCPNNSRPGLRRRRDHQRASQGPQCRRLRFQLGGLGLSRGAPCDRGRHEAAFPRRVIRPRDGERRAGAFRRAPPDCRNSRDRARRLALCDRHRAFHGTAGATHRFRPARPRASQSPLQLLQRGQGPRAVPRDEIRGLRLLRRCVGRRDVTCRACQGIARRRCASPLFSEPSRFGPQPAGSARPSGSVSRREAGLPRHSAASHGDHHPVSEGQPRLAFR